MPGLLPRRVSGGGEGPEMRRNNIKSPQPLRDGVQTLTRAKKTIRVKHLSVMITFHFTQGPDGSIAGNCPFGIKKSLFKVKLKECHSPVFFYFVAVGFWLGFFVCVSNLQASEWAFPTAVDWHVRAGVAGGCTINSRPLT